MGTQECEECVDVSSVAQESPLLEIPLLAPVDTLVERVEHTLRGPSVDELSFIVERYIDEVSRAMSKFSSDSSPQQIGKVPRDMSRDKVPAGAKLSRFVTKFPKGSCLLSYHPVSYAIPRVPTYLPLC